MAVFCFRTLCVCAHVRLNECIGESALERRVVHKIWLAYARAAVTNLGETNQALTCEQYFSPLVMPSPRNWFFGPKLVGKLIARFQKDYS